MCLSIKFLTEFYKQLGYFIDSSIHFTTVLHGINTISE